MIQWRGSLAVGVTIAAMTLAVASSLSIAPVHVVEAAEETNVRGGAATSGSPFVEAQFQTGKAQRVAGISDRPLEEIIGKIIQGILSLTGVIFFALMVYAGYLWMTAQGEEDKITKAKGVLRTAVIGFAVTLAAYAISILVISKITGAAMGVSE